MPKQCKPTREAVWTRIEAAERLNRINDATFHDNYRGDYIVPIEIFGIKHKIKKEGLFTIDDIIEELKK